MCFITESAWCARLAHRDIAKAEKETSCDECRRPILAGQMRHWTYLQEYEECADCESGDCECGPVDCCQCLEPSIGETFEWECCEDCHKFLAAVKQAEVESGCRPSESQPALCEMVNDISDGGMDEAKKYWLKAVGMFPELKVSGYLGWLWRKTFGVSPMKADR